MEDFTAIVLAAGKGTRMKSNLVKVLHPILGRPMLDYVLDNLWEAGIHRIVVVVGRQGEAVAAEVEDFRLRKKAAQGAIRSVWQEKQLGTAHAVKVALEDGPVTGSVLITYGDVPLLRVETIRALAGEHQKEVAAATLLSASLDDPTGYGRIVRDQTGEFLKIVEEPECNEEERRIREANTGVYCFQTGALRRALENVNNNNRKQEYYLTDVPAILRADGLRVVVRDLADPREVIGVNDRIQLQQAEMVVLQKLIRDLMQAGVTVIDPGRTYIEPGVEVGRDSIIWPNCYLKGSTRIGENCEIGPDVELQDAVIERGAVVTRSVVLNSRIGEHVLVGPYAYVRPGTTAGEGSKIGTFVEVKNSQIGAGTKISHLSYVGDATVGEDCNIGAGTITCNFSGKAKYRTTLGTEVFVGSNTNLVAPVEVGDRSFIAAGSTITDDVPPDSFAIARERQTTKPGYMLKKRQEDNK